MVVLGLVFCFCALQIGLVSWTSKSYYDSCDLYKMSEGFPVNRV